MVVTTKSKGVKLYSYFMTYVGDIFVQYLLVWDNQPFQLSRYFAKAECRMQNPILPQIPGFSESKILTNVINDRISCTCTFLIMKPFWVCAK